MTVWDVASTGERKDHIELWRKLERQQENSIKLDSMHKRKDGSTFPVEIQIARIESQNQTLMLALARDMTDHKKAEATLQKDPR